MESKSTLERDYEKAPEIAELGLEVRPDGLGAAAMFAAAIGVFALGLLTVLAEASVGSTTGSRPGTSDRASVPSQGRRPSPSSSGS
jgi:hypothetical protein